MRPLVRRRLRELVRAALCSVPLWAPACRVGYEELPLSLSAGAGGQAPTGESGSGAAGARPEAGGTTAGTSSGAGQNAAGSSGAGGQRPEGGAANLADAGDGPAIAAGGAATAAGANAGGAAGDGETPGCTSTADCACAAFEDHSYWFCKTTLTFSASTTACEGQGMHLVRIDSAGENDFLLSTSAATGLFAFNAFAQIGANDLAVAGEWRWLDGTQFWQGGSSGAVVGGAYESWDPASPSSQGTKNCAGMLDTGLWQNRSCTAVSPYVCEQP